MQYQTKKPRSKCRVQTPSNLCDDTGRWARMRDDSGRWAGVRDDSARSNLMSPQLG